MSDAIEEAREIIAASENPAFHAGDNIAMLANAWDAYDDALRRCGPVVARALLSAVEGGRETCDAGAPPRPSTAEKALREALLITDICYSRGFTMFAARTIDAELGLGNEAQTAMATGGLAKWVTGKRRSALASPSTEGWRDGWKEGREAAARVVAARGDFDTDWGSYRIAMQQAAEAVRSIPVPEQVAEATVLPEPKASTS